MGFIRPLMVLNDDPTEQFRMRGVHHVSAVGQIDDLLRGERSGSAQECEEHSRSCIRSTHFLEALRELLEPAFLAEHRKQQT
jgi:hypothetical protein